MPTSKLYDELLDILFQEFKEHKISRLELERMIDSQFRVVRDVVGNKNAEVTKIPYLGKIIPTKGHKYYVKYKKVQRDN